MSLSAQAVENTRLPAAALHFRTFQFAEAAKVATATRAHGPALCPHPRLDLRPRQLPLSGWKPAVRPDRRAHDDVHRALAWRGRSRGAARPEDALSRQRHHA